jgi:hypothetical protein
MHDHHVGAVTVNQARKFLTPVSNFDMVNFRWQIDSGALPIEA